MKSILLQLIFLIIPFLSFAQCPGSPPAGYTCIPDSNFEQALIDLTIDSEGTLDGQVLTADIDGVTSINVSNKSISDLDGIEDFISLTSLFCNNNNITSLDLTFNVSLDIVNCYTNGMTNLTLPNSDSLTTLRAHNNLLASIDVSQHINLLFLGLSNNSLTSIDVMQNTQLTTLNTFNNQLTELDVSNSTDLINFQTQFNSLTFLDISNNPNLTFFVCIDNLLEGINIQSGNNTNLSGANCYLYNNPNLICIQVDDATWSTANWYLKDSWASFNEDCNYLNLEEVSKLDFKIYPNPVNNVLILDSQQELRFTTFNVLGKSLQKGIAKLGKTELDISSLSGGAYFIKFETDFGSITKKIIKI